MSTATTDAIVIGAGVAGLSCAMQLARRGLRVTVLERERIANGSTGRAAGFLGQLRGTPEHTRMLMDGVKIVQELEEQLGRRIFLQTGSMRIAATPKRADEIRRLVAMGREIGFPIDLIPIRDVARLLPHMGTDDLVEACYCPTDGHLEPTELAEAYIQVGRQLGVVYLDHTPVTQILVDRGRVQGVRTGRGSHHARIVVNAAGPWSYVVAQRAQQRLAVAAVRHCYLTTYPLPDRPVDPLSPAVRDRESRIYARAERGGLLVGLYGSRPFGIDTAHLPDDFDMSRMVPNDDGEIRALLDAASRRFPWISGDIPFRVTTGIMTFSPDARPLCGPLPGIEGLYHCSGFSGHGIVQSPVIGVIMADLILDGATGYDQKAIAADRFWDLPEYQTREGIESRCLKMYCDYYGQVEGKGSERH